MKIFRMLFILALSLSFSVASAQTEFHGEAAYGLKGNVKKVKLKTKSRLQYLPKSASFTRDGRIARSLINYDEAGYPTGYNLSGRKDFVSLEITYNQDKMPETMVLVNGMRNPPMKSEFHNYYSSSGQLEKTVLSTPSRSDFSITFYYSDYKYDSEGNWIERTVDLEKKVGENVETDRLTETRKIKYFGN